MPDAPHRPCKSPGCPTLAVGSNWCDEHKTQRHKYSNRQHRENSHDRGYDYKWRVFRAGFLKGNPLCVDCLTIEGRPEPATEVHHTLKLADHPEHKYDRGTLLSLCRNHHQRRTNAGE